MVCKQTMPHIIWSFVTDRYCAGLSCYKHAFDLNAIGGQLAIFAERKLKKKRAKLVFRGFRSSSEESEAGSSRSSSRGLGGSSLLSGL